MSKVMVRLEAARFTQTTAVLSALKALLEDYPDWKVQLLIPASKAEEYAAEIGEWRTLGRVRVLLESGTQEELFD